MLFVPHQRLHRHATDVEQFSLHGLPTSFGRLVALDVSSGGATSE